MRALIITPALPYPMHQGGALRNFGILRGLHDARHDITLLSFADGSIDPQSTPLVEICRRVEVVPMPGRSKTARLRDLLTSNMPDLARRLESTAFRARLEALLAESRFDLVQFEGLETTIYLEQVRQKQPQARLIYDAHNAEHALQRVIFGVDRADPGRLPIAAYSWIQAERITHFERSICGAVDAIIACSGEDAAALRALQPGKRVEIIPNGIFAESYHHSSAKLDLGEQALLFTGKMDYRPNVDAVLWFTASILPRIRQQAAEARLYIVGQKPHPRLLALRDMPGIEITGWVADIQPFLHAAAVYVAPLRMGSGTRLKLLEAMASGCAVVATTAAASGLTDEMRAHLVIADDPADFADAVTALFNDPARRQMLGAAAQQAVGAVYDWSALIPCLLELYREIGLG